MLGFKWLVALLGVSGVSAFRNAGPASRPSALPRTRAAAGPLAALPEVAAVMPEAAAVAAVAGVAGRTTLWVAEEAASATADLPPVWVPLGVAALLLVGIGALQLDLGDVFGEEALLDNAIGDKAKSTRESRDRSYFSGSGGEL
uniref:Uncharacterized protein n=1 Tax=Phaeomonas parva TaxID=124430 RepID=A0A6U4CKI4_9STRA|mmetsp:Transcript_11574/g.35160  ORF Transcript_11574/g.35160 Transcript_11574/m.35160 type:complete len:144 (+) Transcript_11574:116-547(+)|eukprot:CAMPEP_0118860326 /NCGR_PEP_ID=MMETSP1163-20130328/6216_1 /TAXON_ID=124430 /ORGANISM="Phaeomonas parva, Strain CCMP2877" /LENGTH=143 /DNA_ID=CAMNT_0006794005 /DNA_START=106 /DNA_END=537 /DNA_ORIENTATION=+